MGAFWRVRKDGTGRERLFNNMASTDVNDWTFSPNNILGGLDGFTVRDGVIFASRMGTGSVLDPYYPEMDDAPCILRIENGQARAIFTGARATATTYETINNFATVPGWVLFTLSENTPVQNPGGWIDPNPTSAVYRVRLDGTGLERLTNPT